MRRASLFPGGHVTHGKTTGFAARHGRAEVVTLSAAWDWPVAQLLDVHDGDTVRLNVDQGFEDHGYRWIRLLDVFAPELDEPDGDRAKTDVRAWFASCAPDGYVRLTTYRSSAPLEIRFRQSFTRYVGIIGPPKLSATDPSLNAWQLQHGWSGSGVT